MDNIVGTGQETTRTRTSAQGPVARNLLPANPLQTRFFGASGPDAVVCVHVHKGFYMGHIGRNQAWSHDPASHGWLSTGHPDLLRAAASWPSEAEARHELTARLSYADWTRIAFATVRCDIATSPNPTLPLADPTPIWHCSIEACAAATSHFPPHSYHLLQRNMIHR
jgi:hypothetical protein